MTPRFLRSGDRALLVELGNAIDPDLNAEVRALDEALQASPFPGYEEAVPTYRSLLVFFDPDAYSFDAAKEHIGALLGALDTTSLPEPPLKEVPAVYDGDDLDDVARLAGISKEDVVRLHSGTEYRVYMVGFTPGFAYMGMTDEALDLPRRASPRTRVPAGSLAIAMGQTGIYPSVTPGGWHLLGRAEHRTLFALERDPPSFFSPGDCVKFVPVDELPELTPRKPAPRVERSPSIEVEEGGLLTTVQDYGRPGFQRFGVPVAGAADRAAFEDANELVGNDPAAAALECTVDGPRLRVVRTTIAAVAGADLGAVVERSDLGTWRPPPSSSFVLRAGNVLAFEGRRTGARAYVAFAGGIDVPTVLGSRSTYLTASLGGYEGRSLRAGDRLALGSTDGLRPAGRVLPRAEPKGEAAVRIVWGPQDDTFTDAACATLLGSTYTVGAASDRMGCRLEGALLEHRDEKEIISDGNALGSIQVPPNGQPIVMLADRATTGGYPKIATVVTEDVCLLAQLLPGDRVTFRV